MNSFDIYKLVKRDIVLKKNFNGVFSADNFTPVSNGIYIVNTQPSYLKGSHWVVYYMENGLLEFFDSYGKNGVSYGLKNSITFNTRTLQQNISSCGYYCLYYSLLRCRGISLYRIVRSLLNNVCDIYVVKSVLKHFSISNRGLKRSLARY